MDNGLIFPYPCMRDHDESVILTTQKHLETTLWFFGVDAWDLIW